MTTTYFEWHESMARANALADAMIEHGIAAETFADPRASFPAARIFLTEDRDENAPCLLIGTEETREIVAGHHAAEWYGELYGFALEISDVSIRMIERPHLGMGVEEIADQLSAFVQIMIHSAAQANADFQEEVRP